MKTTRQPTELTFLLVQVATYGYWVILGLNEQPPLNMLNKSCLFSRFGKIFRISDFFFSLSQDEIRTLSLGCLWSVGVNMVSNRHYLAQRKLFTLQFNSKGFKRYVQILAFDEHQSCTSCKLDRHYVRFVQYLQNIKYYQRDIYWYVCLCFETPNFKPLNRSITRMLKLYINLNVLRSLMFFNMPIGVCFWTLGNQY